MAFEMSELSGFRLIAWNSQEIQSLCPKPGNGIGVEWLKEYGAGREEAIFLFGQVPLEIIGVGVEKGIGVGKGDRLHTIRIIGWNAGNEKCKFFIEFRIVIVG